MRKLSAFLVLLTVAVATILMGPPAQHVIHAQYAANVPGFAVTSTNATPPTVIGSALAVTNPASNFVVLVQGGPVYCSGIGGAVAQGALETAGQSTLTLLANTTYQIEYNCASSAIYAKVGVVTGGSAGTSATSGPGNPATILAPIPGLEVPIATVVCNATACGNGGNGSITDNRPLGNFSGAGTPLATTTFAGLPTTNVTDGTMIICSSCTQPTTGSVTPCATGAAAVFAVRVAGAWRCY